MPHSDELARYRARRDPDRTPEPMGGAAGPSGHFVVQKHAARRLHWDLRLAVGGVLKSWAVPHGPSLDPAVKRFAVATEDHPLEYAEFEGTIPSGQYGGGAMIVWDRGLAVHRVDPGAGLVDGKLLFELRGYKLRGLWTLVATKRAGEWLLIKERDGWAREGESELDEGSVLSGLTVEELASAPDRARELSARLDELGAPRRRVPLADVTPMLAETADGPFDRDGWLFELKYDGYRLLAGREAGRPLLVYRSGRRVTSVFPEIARALAAWPWPHVVIDGEVVILGEDGRPVFRDLQKRGQLTGRLDVARAALELPATLYAFDLLAFGEHDLRPLPLEQRKELLLGIVPRSGPIRYLDHVASRGVDLYRAVREMGLEGVMAKDASSPYAGRRAASWLKIRSDRTDEFVVVGATPPEGSRAGFGALHLAAWDGPRLLYAGRVGSGFSQADLAAIDDALAPLARTDPVCSGAPAGDEQRWVEPELVAEVRYKEWPGGGHLRQPVFLRLRDDRGPETCRRRRVEPPPDRPPAPPGRGRDLVLKNLEKVFWPQDGYTKGDLVAYYRAVGPVILPYLARRPLVLDRYPDGIDGGSFYQKNAPDHTPDWITTEPIWSEESGRDIRYFVCDDLDTLLYAVNQGAIPLHVWSSRLPSLDRPDWCLLDLDPKKAPFAAVVEVALAIKALADEIELPLYAKTSGSSGLHLLVPLGRQLTYDQSRTLGQLLARCAVAARPTLATLERTIAARGKRVYVDVLQNRWGQLCAAPYCVRPLPGAPVSTPLDWSEVGADLDPGRFTIETVPVRLEERPDPMRAVLTDAPDLLAALEHLAERL